MAENRTLKGIYGEHGARFESGTTAITGEFCAILCLSTVVFAAITWDELDPNSDAITGVAIPEGTTLYGQIGGFTLTSGNVLAYKAGK